MIKRRPLGVTLWGGVLTVTGGLTMLILFLEILISVNMKGLASLSISSLHALGGFCLYAAFPFFVYLTGIGLFLLRPWARRAMLHVIPFFLFFFLFNIGCYIVQSAWHRKLDLSTIYQIQPEVFSKLFFLFLLLTASWNIYFRNPQVVRYFQTID